VPVGSEPELRELYEEPHDLAVRKELQELDVHCRRFIAASPFLCIASADADGRVDVSPRGDPPGFVRVLDERTLLVPDRPGNNRLDTMRNLLTRPRVGLIFFVPGRDDTLRVNGKAKIVADVELLAPSEVNGKVPRSGLVVEVEEVFLHCARALKRARLWTAEPPPSDLPSFAEMLSDHARTAVDDELVRAEDAKLY
jgi:PPOX class probable FMN-dependent enzyme